MSCITESHPSVTLFFPREVEIKVISVTVTAEVWVNFIKVLMTSVFHTDPHYVMCGTCGCAAELAAHAGGPSWWCHAQRSCCRGGFCYTRPVAVTVRGNLGNRRCLSCPSASPVVKAEQLVALLSTARFPRSAQPCGANSADQHAGSSPPEHARQH